jgi:sodium transport system permease protein
VKGLGTVFFKEVIDNLRDRRTLLTVLILGPLLGPVLFSFVTGAALKQAINTSGKPLDLPVVGAGRAPHLVQFLAEHNTRILPPPQNVHAAIENGAANVVLVIPKRYPPMFRQGRPAAVKLVMDKSKHAAGKDIVRAEQLLKGYAREIGYLRLTARGVDPRVVTPVVVEEADLSTPASRAALALSMVPYFVIFAVIMGAFYLAIDTTAGERERGSLEPLLTTAVTRTSLVLGKLLATTVFAAVSLVLTVAAFSVSLRLIPLAALNMTANFGPRVATLMLLVNLPLAFLAAALLTVIASFTKSFKEAQTYLSLALMVPLIPTLLTALWPFQPALWMMLVPSLSQDLLIVDLLKAEPLDPIAAGLSCASTLVVGALLAGLAVWLYRREKVLG